MLKMFKLFKTNSLRHFSSLKDVYRIPEKYRNAFYLANAPLFDYTNWFIHNAYEECFPSLVKELQAHEPSLDLNRAVEKVFKIINWLEPCGSLIDVNFPVRRSDGHYEIIRGFRAMHGPNLYGTPSLGGMRICSDLNKDHVKAFSVLSTFKHACLGIEMSGAHGGLKLSGCDYEPQELKDIVVSYGKELAKRGFLDSSVDILEPDLYCSSQEMEWIAEEFANKSEFDDKFGIACAVGKPRSVGGLEIYDKYLASGVLYALKLFMNEKKFMSEIQLDGDLIGKTFIIQGLGKVGSQIVTAMVEAGAKCIGVKEHDAYIYMDEGIPTEELIEYKNKNESIQEFNKHTKPSSIDQIYTEPCDILIFAATHRSLQCYVAERVQAKIVIEAAHAAITPTAHKVLLAQKRLVLPDLYAGCGASIASYLEYVKNLQHAPNNILINRLATLVQTSLNSDTIIDMQDETTINTILEIMMKRTYDDIITIMKNYHLGLDVRTAAYINAIHKIFRRIIESRKY